MDFRDISKMRVTVRKFDQRPVEKEKIDLILEAGRWSPTAVDYQPQRILVLNTPENLNKVRQFCTFGYDKKYAELTEECDTADHKHNVYYYGAPLVFLICWDKTVCWTHPQSGQSSGSTDATIVTTHMMLEAASLGLGTVWISYFDHDKARELLGIPENFEINGMLYVGYPAKDFKPNPHMSGKRHPIAHTCFDNSFAKPYRTDFFEEAATVTFRESESNGLSKA
ncbi:MAG: nitroreductase family protein [Oscillospiraceae bacterium]|nr:nitroreductase family protein [Oscillospiraceae bacterium]